MRGMVLAGCVAAVCAGGARAQSGLLGVLGSAGSGQGMYGSSVYGQGGYGQGAYGQGGGDPCRAAPPSGMSGGAFGALANMMTAPQRSRDCADLRRAQWAEYSAKQKAAKDKADADAAAAKKAADDAASAKAAADAQQASAHAAASARRSAEAAVRRREREAARVDEARAQRVADAAAARDRRVAEVSRRAAYVRMVAAENAPDNVCRQPKLARAVMEGWNGLDAFRDQGVRVIDIEHVVTVAGGGGVACHGVFVTNKGWRVAGTTVMKRNVAGDPLFVWQRDERQDLAAYEAPAMDAGSPEAGSGVSVGAAVPVVSEAADGRM